MNRICIMHRTGVHTGFWQENVKVFFFFYSDYETIGTAATPGLLCQPRVIVKMIFGEHDGM
jgi:hypothetical protein